MGNETKEGRGGWEWGREPTDTPSVVDTEAGLAWEPEVGGYSTSRSMEVGKPFTGGPWQLGEQCQVPQWSGSHACGSTCHFTSTSVVGELRGLMFGDSSNGVFIGLVCGSASCLLWLCDLACSSSLLTNSLLVMSFFLSYWSWILLLTSKRD